MLEQALEVYALRAEVRGSSVYDSTLADQHDERSDCSCEMHHSNNELARRLQTGSKG